ncbi:GtrA family protein [Microbacterium sp. XT11]|uniref:GtrA family protein n=1 Tax=Microbacterium sp. XT11 TaxID=367477 RepID=UPI0018DBB3E5|nr:GtrA family protein [Microbacterium sp. XT11]
MSDPHAAERSGLMAQMARFAAVGGGGVVVDVVVFNALLTVPVGVAGWALVAKAASTAVAIVVNWIGNRLWTFRDRRRADVLQEGMEFAVASIVGAIVPLMCLGLSHYVLGFTSRLADNIAANVIGLALGSAVRFAAYRWWVFGDGRAPASRAVSASETGRVTTIDAPMPG